MYLNDKDLGDIGKAIGKAQTVLRRKLNELELVTGLQFRTTIEVRAYAVHDVPDDPRDKLLVETITYTEVEL